jgi:hypothetical protein
VAQARALIPLSSTLRHQNAVTWTCDQYAWFSFIYITIVITPLFCNNTWVKSKLSFFFIHGAFSLAGCLLTFFQSSKELLFSSPFLSKYVVREALLIGPLAPRLAASTTVSLEW